MRLKKDKSGDTVSPPSWKSSLLGDPGAKFFCGKPQHMKNSLNFANTCLKVVDTRRRGPNWPSEIQRGYRVGDFVQGSLRFSVDPFFYFERHYKLPSIPPLIYEWQVNSIEQNTTPYVLSDDGRMYMRDE